MATRLVYGGSVQVGEAFRGGEGAPLVLLHSGFSTWVEWRPTISILSPERAVLAPTLPGSEGGPPLELNGGTMLAAQADYVEDLLDAQGWDAPAIAGSSFGGVLALELAARGRANQVVGLAPPWVAGRGIPFYGAMFATPLATFRLTERLHGRAAASRRLVSLAFHGSLEPAVIDPVDAAAIWRSFGRFPFWRVGLRAFPGGPGMPETSRIECPVTLVWGTRDRPVPGWMWRRWEEALPDASVETLPGFPHMPHLRDPERVAKLILGATATAAG